LLTDFRGQVILGLLNFLVHKMLLERDEFVAFFSAGLLGVVYISNPSLVKSLLTSCFFFHADDAIDCVHADVKATASRIFGNESKYENLNPLKPNDL
jgi:hypothetical protein